MEKKRKREMFLSTLRQNKEIIILLFVYIFIYSFNLDKFPIVWTDEAWFINPSFNLAMHGFLGTTVKYGFNIAEYTYWQPPVYLVLLATSFKLFGYGIIQARMVSVVLGFITVLFTYLLGRRLYDKKVGLLAAAILIFNLLFFYVSRDVRMDIAAACFTLMGLYFLLVALKESKLYNYFLSSFFVILGALSHPVGIIGIISAVIILIMCKINFRKLEFNLRKKEITSLILGIILPLLPYLWYISLDFQSFKGQIMGNVGSSAMTPLNNILLEPIRYFKVYSYVKGIDGFLLTFILVIITLYLVAIGLIYLFKNRSFNNKFLAIILLTNILIFAVLVVNKYYWYLAILLPYFAILCALPLRNFEIRKNISFILILLLLGYLLINSIGFINIFQVTADYDYKELKPQFEENIPYGSVILGDPVHWITLHDNYIYYAHHDEDVSTYRELNIGYILYDDYWSKINNPRENAIKAFIKENCTFVTELYPQYGIKFIKIYKIEN